MFFQLETRGLSVSKSAMQSYQLESLYEVNEVHYVSVTVVIPEMLKQVADSQQVKVQTTTKPPQNKLLSIKNIPFKLPLELRSILAKPHSERFKMDLAGVCHLNGDLTTPCAVCCQIKWTASETMSNTLITTQNSILKAVSK